MKNDGNNMVSLYQYLELIKPKIIYKDEYSDRIKEYVNKFLENKRRAARNASHLEKILA